MLPRSIKICTTYSQSMLSDGTAQMVLSFSFLKYREKNTFHSNRPSVKKVDEFSAKVEQADMSSRNVVRKLNIYHQTFKPFEGSWLQKKTQRLDAIRIHA